MQAVSPSLPPSLRLAAAPQCNAQSIAPVARRTGKGESAQLADIHPRESAVGTDWKRDRAMGRENVQKKGSQYIKWFQFEFFEEILMSCFVNIFLDIGKCRSCFVNF